MKKKLEFSKMITVVAVVVMICVAIWSIINYYILAKLAIETGATILPDSAIPIACITTILGAILSYCLYQFGLKNSRNKYGVDAEGNPIITKLDYESVLEEVDEKVIEYLRNRSNSPVEESADEFPCQVPVDCEYKD